MIITFDRALLTVTASPANLKTAPNQPVTLRLLDAGKPSVLADGETLEVMLKPRGVTDTDVLATLTLSAADRDQAVAAYVAVMDCYTEAALALLGIGDANAANDVTAAVDIDAVVLLHGSADEPLESDTFAVKLAPAKRLPTDASPLTAPTPDTKYLRFDAVEQILSAEDQARVLARIGAAAEGSTSGPSSVAWADVTGKPTDFATTQDITNAVASKADLVDGKVPASQLPSYVDDVIEVADFTSLPDPGEQGKLYVTLDTNKTYRWSGSAYVEITSGLDIASQAEAEAGTDNTKAMTPLRTAEAIAALGGGGGGGGGGPVNWGAIGGTLADQTDLATALSAKIEIGLDGKLPTADGSNLTAVRDGTAVHWRGDFLSGATYAANDISVFDGVPYLCLTPGAYAGIAVGSDWAKLVPLLPLMDTGWSASVSGSNKTDALQTYTSTNFDSVDSGLTALSAQVASLTTRVAALQEAMRDGLRPNA